MIPIHDLMDRFTRGWKGGRPYTECGRGSLPVNTENARQALPKWCATYGLRVVCDAGAGDLRWMRGIEWDVEYHGFDLIPRHPAVKERDISTQALPECDLVICRWVLNHLDPERVAGALTLFRQAGRYLAASQFDGGQRSLGHLDLRPALGEYVETVPDSGVEGCVLALWPLR